MPVAVVRSRSALQNCGQHFRRSAVGQSDALTVEYRWRGAVRIRLRLAAELPATLRRAHPPSLLRMLRPVWLELPENFGDRLIMTWPGQYSALLRFRAAHGRWEIGSRSADQRQCESRRDYGSCPERGQRMNGCSSACNGLGEGRGRRSDWVRIQAWRVTGLIATIKRRHGNREAGSGRNDMRRRLFR
jgi:hypothetical protein